MKHRTPQEIQKQIDALQLELRAAENNETVFVVNGRSVTRIMASNLFDMVADPKNWKNPIDATVNIFDAFSIEVLKRAIMFYTASTANVENVGPHRYRVRAPGYYVNVGA